VYVLFNSSEIGNGQLTLTIAVVLHLPSSWFFKLFTAWDTISFGVRFTVKAKGRNVATMTNLTDTLLEFIFTPFRPQPFGVEINYQSRHEIAVFVCLVINTENDIIKERS